MARNKLNNSLGNLKELVEEGKSIYGTTSNGKFKVTVYTSNIIRIRITKEEDFDDFTYAVVMDPQDVPFKVKEESEKIILSTDAVDLHIQKEPVRFRFTTRDGKVINEDDPAFGTSWIGEETTTYKKLQEGERFVGLGEKTGNLDRRGEGYVNNNTDYFAYPVNGDPLYTTFPFYIGIHNHLAYGIFLDNSYKSFFNFGASNNRFSSFSVEDGEMNYYFIYHEEVSGIIESYAELTGKIDMPPLWSLGYQQCRYSYYPDTEVLNVARNFRERKIPADVIYLDIHYMDAYKIFTWHPTRFPDPDKMMEELKEMGFHVVIIVDPGIKVEKGYSAYHEGKEKDLFVKYPDGKEYTGQVWPGWCHFPDFTKAETREWWGNSFEGYVQNGIDGFWNDMNEIATWGNKLPELMQFDFEGNPSTTKRARNVYGMQMARSTYEGTKKLLNGKRPFVLTRAGYSGVQRYSAVWTGDNIAEEEHMLAGVRLVNSLGLTGVPFAGYDVGGFVGDANIKLFTRWLTIGAFSPFFRGHTMINSRDSEPWSYGEEAEEISRNYIQLRYNLMPYIYSTFYEAHKTGIPVARSLTIQYTHDPKVYDKRFQNQYLFGHAFLVAPAESTKELVRVYLPEGDWYYFHSNDLHKGGKETIVDAPVRRLPLFVKGGSIIPMQSPVQSAAQKPEGLLLMHIYKGTEGNTLEYYEDDGESYEFLHGKFYKRLISYKPSSKEIIMEAVEGKMTSKFRKIKLILHGFEDIGSSLKVDGNKVKPDKERVQFFTPISMFDPIGEAEVLEGLEVQSIIVSNETQRIHIDW